MLEGCRLRAGMPLRRGGSCLISGGCGAGDVSRVLFRRDLVKSLYDGSQPPGKARAKRPTRADEA